MIVMNITAISILCVGFCVDKFSFYLSKYKKNCWILWKWCASYSYSHHWDIILATYNLNKGEGLFQLIFSVPGRPAPRQESDGTRAWGRKVTHVYVVRKAEKKGRSQGRRFSPLMSIAHSWSRSSAYDHGQLWEDSI